MMQVHGAGGLPPATVSAMKATIALAAPTEWWERCARCCVDVTTEVAASSAASASSLVTRQGGQVLAQLNADSDAQLHSLEAAAELAATVYGATRRNWKRK